MNNYCLTANTNGETSVARLGRPFIAGRPPSAARTLEKILAAPSAGAADGGQTLLEAVEAAIVGRCIIEGAPGPPGHLTPSRRRGTTVRRRRSACSWLLLLSGAFPRWDASPAMQYGCFQA